MGIYHALDRLGCKIGETIARGGIPLVAASVALFLIGFCIEWFKYDF